jgi:fatty acid desaturase
MAEKELFNHDGVIITPSRAIFRETMYPISSISAVKQKKTESLSFKENAFYLIGTSLFMAVIGISVGTSITSSLLIGYIYFMLVIACFLSAFLFTTNKETFHIGLHTSGTNIQVYSSPDRKEIEDIVKAINEAIIARS